MREIDVPESIRESFTTDGDVPGGQVNVADGLFAIAESIREVALALDRLGFNTSDYGGQHAMGCVEKLAYVLEKGQLEVHAIVEKDGDL